MLHGISVSLHFADNLANNLWRNTLHYRAGKAVDIACERYHDIVRLWL